MLPNDSFEEYLQNLVLSNEEIARIEAQWPGNKSDRLAKELGIPQSALDELDKFLTGN